VVEGKVKSERIVSRCREFTAEENTRMEEELKRIGGGSVIIGLLWLADRVHAASSRGSIAGVTTVLEKGNRYEAEAV